MKERKPRKQAFVYYTASKISAVLLIIFAAIALTLGIIFTPLLALPVMAVWFALVAIVFLERLVAYRKERYLIHPDRIIHEKGSLWYNKKTELIISNVTNVELTLPWIEHKLLKTGYVSIQSAGGGGTEVRLSSIGTPQSSYDEIIKLLHANGFSLKRGKLVQEEKPHPLAVFFDVFKSFFGFIIFLFYIGSGALTVFAALPLLLATLLIFLFLTLILSYYTLRFLDLKKRVYYVYDDTILFTEGFLTKRSALIPFENLADSELNQTFIDKLFGLYDVTVSAPGSLQALRFSNMRNGTELEKNLDKLIQSHTQTPDVKRPFSEKVSLNPAFEASYTMLKKRALITPALITIALAALLLFILALGTLFFGIEGFLLSLTFLFLATFFVGGFVIGYLVKSFVAAIATRYYINSNSIEERFNFLTTKHKEFTTDKLTGILVQRNFIDGFFNTFSVTFWSIGTAESITLKHLSYSTQLHQQLLQKAGIRSEPTRALLRSSFTLPSFIAANLFALGAVVAILLGIIVTSMLTYPVLSLLLIPLIIMLLSTIAYRRAFYKRTRLTIHAHQTHYQEGILFKSNYYARNVNVKDVTTTRYPLTHRGTVECNVAGEHLKAGKSLRRVSNSFSIAYVTAIEAQDDAIDNLLANRTSKKPIRSSKPALANTMLICGVAGLGLLIALALLYFLSLSEFHRLSATAIAVFAYAAACTYALLRIRAIRYEIDQTRVVYHRGILYKTAQSLFMRNIDHINQSQGPLGKLFKNGNVMINTTGSSMTELTLRDIPDFLDFYKELKKQY